MIPDEKIPAGRIADRKILIQKIKSQLEKDPRVLAAWIAGSVARGDDDWLSDIDLHIVVTDESVAEVIVDRKEFVANEIRPTLVMDMIKNAAPNGAYLLVHYPCEFGLQHVDWFWTPQTGSTRPEDGLLLFDRTGLPVVDGAEWENSVNQTDDRLAIESTDRSDIASHKHEFFWAMAAIVAKYAARRDRNMVEIMLRVINRAIDDLVKLLELNDSGMIRDADEPSCQIPDLFKGLRAAVQRASLIESYASKLGVSTSTEAIDQVINFISVCERYEPDSSLRR